MKTIPLILFLFLIKIRYCRHLSDKLNTDNAAKFENVEEIQHAVCKIATEEIQASANASITRQLKGVCSTKAMNARLDELQKIIITEIEVFKLMLISAGYTTPRPAVSLPIETKSTDAYEDYDYVYDYDNQTHLNIYKSLEYTNKTESLQNNYVKTAGQNKVSVANTTKLLSHQIHSKATGETYPREHEVKKSNETIKTTDMGRTFVYFWRIPEFESLLGDDLEIMSPFIEYLGNVVFIKLATHHLSSSYISLELLTSNKFSKPFRFVIMHKKAKDDFNSSLLGNTKPPFALFRITKKKIQSFINTGALLIKLLVYIDF